MPPRRRGPKAAPKAKPAPKRAAAVDPTVRFKALIEAAKRRGTLPRKDERELTALIDKHPELINQILFELQPPGETLVLPIDALGYAIFHDLTHLVMTLVEKGNALTHISVATAGMLANQCAADRADNRKLITAIVEALKRLSRNDTTSAEAVASAATTDSNTIHESTYILLAKAAEPHPDTPTERTNPNLVKALIAFIQDEHYKPEAESLLKSIFMLSQMGAFTEASKLFAVFQRHYPEHQEWLVQMNSDTRMHVLHGAAFTGNLMLFLRLLQVDCINPGDICPTLGSVLNAILYSRQPRSISLMLQAALEKLEPVARVATLTTEFYRKSSLHQFGNFKLTPLAYALLNPEQDNAVIQTLIDALVAALPTAADDSAAAAAEVDPEHVAAIEISFAQALQVVLKILHHLEFIPQLLATERLKNMMINGQSWLGETVRTFAAQYRIPDFCMKDESVLLGILQQLHAAGVPMHATEQHLERIFIRNDEIRPTTALLPQAAAPEPREERQQRKFDRPGVQNPRRFCQIFLAPYQTLDIIPGYWQQRPQEDKALVLPPNIAFACVVHEMPDVLAWALEHELADTHAFGTFKHTESLAEFQGTDPSSALAVSRLSEILARRQQDPRTQQFLANVPKFLGYPRCYNALQLAFILKRWDLVRQLLAFEATVEVGPTFSTLALAYLCEAPTDILQLLREQAEADETLVAIAVGLGDSDFIADCITLETINSQNNETETSPAALSIILERPIETLLWLLDHGADPNLGSKEAFFGNTPLHFAIRYNLREHFDALLAHDNIDVDTTNALGDTPLHECALWGRRDMAEALIAAKAEPTLRNHQGHTAKRVAQHRSPGGNVCDYLSGLSDAANAAARAAIPESIAPTAMTGRQFLQAHYGMTADQADAYMDTQTKAEDTSAAGAAAAGGAAADAAEHTTAEMESETYTWDVPGFGKISSDQAIEVDNLRKKQQPLTFFFCSPTLEGKLSKRQFTLPSRLALVGKHAQYGIKQLQSAGTESAGATAADAQTGEFEVKVHGTPARVFANSYICNSAGGQPIRLFFGHTFDKNGAHTTAGKAKVKAMGKAPA